MVDGRFFICGYFDVLQYQVIINTIGMHTGCLLTLFHIQNSVKLQYFLHTNATVVIIFKIIAFSTGTVITSNSIITLLFTARSIIVTFINIYKNVSRVKIFYNNNY